MIKYFLMILFSVVVLAGCAKEEAMPPAINGDDLSLAQEGNGGSEDAPQIDPNALQKAGQGQTVTSGPTAKPSPAASPTVNAAKPKIAADQTGSKSVRIETAKGDIFIELYPKDAPNTVANFLGKAQKGFYNNLTFHRVEDWVIQGGDPLGTGTGGSTMPAEYNQLPFKVGSVGIARGGDKNFNNDSQFFICVTDCSFLTGNYTNFGTVTSGLDVAKQIQIGDKIKLIEENSL